MRMRVSLSPPSDLFDSLYRSFHHPQLFLSLKLSTTTASNSEQDAYYLQILYACIQLSPLIWFVIYGICKGIQGVYRQVRRKGVTGDRWGDLFEVFIQESDILAAERSESANVGSPVSIAEESGASASLLPVRTELLGEELSPYRRRRKWGLLIPLAVEFVGCLGWSIWIAYWGDSEGGSLLRYAGNTWFQYLSSSVCIPILFAIVWVSSISLFQSRNNASLRILYLI